MLEIKAKTTFNISCDILNKAKIDGEAHSFAMSVVKITPGMPAT